ncbi:unnamed protein product [Rotaria sp. Silwood1]|nr:unnamed protein product [Rotaria sp. Silwood1]
MEINNQLDTITCIPCLKFKKHAPKHLLSTIKSSFGSFEYVEQDATRVQSERFRNLKKALRHHYLNKLHIWCVEEDEKRKQLFDDFLRKNEKAGWNVGRAALFCIQGGLGGLKFVDTLNLLDISGASVGTYSEYLHSVDPVTQRRRPFGITLDKVTLLKRSMQVTIMIVMIDGQLTPLYLQSPLCQTELTGEDLASNCVRVLESFGLKKNALQEQFTGCAVDGAYINLQIEKHLCQKLGMRERWLTVSWDSAHLLELAINDAKKQSKFSWLQRFIKTCGTIMKKYSYGKSYEHLLEAAELVEEQILQPKQFHITRFVQSELRVYETVLRDWSTLYYLQEQDSVINSLAGGNVSARTRRNIDTEYKAGDSDNVSYKHEDIKSVDFVCKLIGLNDIYNILVRASMSVQQVNKYPWEHDDSIRYLQKCLNGYSKLLEQLDLNKTQEMDSLEECEEPEPVGLLGPTIDDDCDIQEEDDEDTQVRAMPSAKYIEQYYQDLLKCEFKQRPIIIRPGDYDLEDPTTHARKKLIELCQQLVETITTRFREIPYIFILMKNCLDVSRLYDLVVSTGKQTMIDYGRVELQGLIEYTLLNSEYIQIDGNTIQDQYSEWKRRVLHEIKEKDTLDIWTTNGELITSKVMKSFYTSTDLSDGINDFLYFHSLMVLKIRSEAICESAASILKGHIHGNRSLHHDSLDNEVMLHWNAPPLHLADSFIKHSLDHYFSSKKEKNWLFYKKSEQYQTWKLLSPGSVVLNHLRKKQVPKLPESIDN